MHVCGNVAGVTGKDASTPCNAFPGTRTHTHKHSHTQSHLLLNAPANSNVVCCVHSGWHALGCTRGTDRRWGTFGYSAFATGRLPRFASGTISTKKSQ